jgi:hypothetical protein
MSSQKFPRKVVPNLLAVCAISVLSDVGAQENAACGVRAEALMKQAVSLLQLGAGTGGQRSDGQGRAFQYFGLKCVEENRCGAVEANVSLIEASLDDAMVALQRQKLAKFKAVLADIRASRNEACAAEQKLETLSTELKAISDQQANRLDQLAVKLFADYVGPAR